MRYGSAPKLSLEDNAISKVYYTGQLKSRGLIDSKKVNGFANRILKEFLVKYDNSKQSVSELSGGNVQKLIVGREFDYDPDLLIMNQPTRGIDVGAHRVHPEEDRGHAGQKKGYFTCIRRPKRDPLLKRYDPGDA